jgi:hypothetical protein
MSEEKKVPANPPRRLGDHLHPSKDQDARPWFASDDDQAGGSRSKPDPAYHPPTVTADEDQAEREKREKDQP